AQEFFQIEEGEEGNLAKEIIKKAEEFGGAFIQEALSGGGVGNLAVRAGVAEESLIQWLKGRRGSKIAVAPLLKLIASHTVSGFIPPEGKPFTYGLFEQVLDPATHDYLGFKWPAEHEQQKAMITYAEKWFEFLQKEGYIGPSDVDFILGYNPQLGEVLAASESNTRWDAFRFALAHVARMLGWDNRSLAGVNPLNAPGIYQIDHVLTRLSSTESILERWKEEKVPRFGIDGSSEGVLVMVPPREKEAGNWETALATIGESPQKAERLFNEAKEAIV
ncbi:MAG: hypothetical protein ACPLXP_02545, partial [Microgenomates group bacterium]